MECIIKKYLIAVFVPVLLYAVYLAQEAIIALIWLLVSIFALILVSSFVLGVWYIVERMKMVRASRIEQEKQAHVMTITNNGQTWIRDTDHKAYWKAGHLEQRVYSNGHYSEPSPVEAMAWQMFNTPKSVNGNGKTQLLAEVVQAPLDLLTTLENEQRVLIKGVSNSGKTNLLQWIASRKVSYSKVLVIDPHASPDKWSGCKVVGLGSNHNEIAIALDRLIDLMIKRYQDIATGKIKETEHSKITIIVDEWMSIAYECKNAKQVMVRLLTESRKAAFSVYVGSHSDRVASLGLDGKGDLRDGFCMTRLSLINGNRQATIDYGNGELSATLPGLFVNNKTIDTNDFINLKVKPSAKEIAIINLFNQGKSYNEIAKQVFGNVGGKQTEKIKEIIGKFE